MNNCYEFFMKSASSFKTPAESDSAGKNKLFFFMNFLATGTRLPEVDCLENLKIRYGAALPIGNVV